MSDWAGYFRAVNGRFAELETEIESLRRRADNLVREGRVTKVDPEKGTAEVDMNGLPSDALPIAHRSGAIREWNPPAVGERVIVLNPSGDPGMGQVLPGGYSDEFKQPHAKGGESFKTIGTTSILQTGDKIVFTVGATTLTLEAGGTTLKTPKFKGVKG